MEKTIHIVFTGESGKQYCFTSFPKGSYFDNISAVYIFTRRYLNQAGQYEQEALYIGESANLGKRIINHDKWEYVNALGCTHICVMPISGKDAREDAETDLIRGNPTPCNQQ